MSRDWFMRMDWQAGAAVAQAILSAAAIAFSVWLVNRQHRLDVAEAARTSRAAQAGRLAAVSAEIATCSKQATVYAVQFFQEGLKVPGYRLPRLAHDHALPALLCDGILQNDEVESLLLFYFDVLAFNRSLDMLDRLIMEGAEFYAQQKIMFDRQADWAVQKALQLVPASAPERHAVPPRYETVVSRFEAATAAIARAKRSLAG